VGSGGPAFQFAQTPIEELFEDKQPQDHFYRGRVASMEGGQPIAPSQVRPYQFQQFLVIFQEPIQSFQEGWRLRCSFRALSPFLVKLYAGDEHGVSSLLLCFSLFSLL
jgi:hypothetical protein